MNVRKIPVTAMLGVLSIATPTLSRAQTVAPSQLTPQSLRPGFGISDDGITLRGGSALTPPSNLGDLDVLVSQIKITGNFAELELETEAEIRRFSGRRLSVSQIYDFAQTLEKIYARAGYTLARVTVPPQKLVDRGQLIVIVVDGFIEDIDVSNLPDRVRTVVTSRVGFLIGRRHIKLGEIERGLLLAGDVRRSLRRPTG